MCTNIIKDTTTNHDKLLLHDHRQTSGLAGADMFSPRVSSRETLNGKGVDLKHRQHRRLIQQKPGHGLTFRYVVALGHSYAESVLITPN